MTDVFLAYSASDHTVPSFGQWDWDSKPISLLVSFFYIEGWKKHRKLCKPAKLMLDSGAYSAWNANKMIDLEALTEESKRSEWNEAISLDVIGDPEKTWRNTVWQLEQGAPVYPVFHIGEPWEYLERYCEQFPKVGLSCRFGETPTESTKWIEQCFARQWPHRFHSFGWVKEKMLMTYPFDSADTSSWLRRPTCWGIWNTYGKVQGLRGTVNLANEMQVYWDLQQRLKQRWQKELARWN